MPTIHLTPDTDGLAPAIERLTGHLRQVLDNLSLRPPTDIIALSEALDPLMAEMVAIRVTARPPATYFEAPDRESLFNQDVDAAIMTHLEEDYETPEDFPETVTISRFRRMAPRAPDYQHPSHLSPLSDLLERLDEEHLNPCEQATEPTEAMTRAETQLVQTVLLEYNPYWYEASSSIEVDVRAWLAHHRPEMMPIRSFTTAICGHCHNPRGAQAMRTCTACLKRGCSRCWRRAEASPFPWPRIHYAPRSCGFRLSDESENRKERDQRQPNELHRGWQLRSEGPVHAE